MKTTQNKNSKPVFQHAALRDYTRDDVEANRIKIKTEKEYKDIINILNIVGVETTFSVVDSVLYNSGFYEVTLVNGGLQELCAFYDCPEDDNE